VLVGSRNFERGEAAAKEIGQGAIALQLDVTDRPSIAAAAERIRKEFGRLDLLVNNAAISNTKKGNLSLQDYAKITLASNASLDEIRAVWETNVLGSAERDANLATTERRQCLQCQLPQGRIGPKRYIHVYDPVEGNPCYTLVTRDKDGQEEIGVWYCNGATELAAQFYVIQLEWITDKWRHDGRSGAWFSQKPLARH
jgi:NAD(P)-dependent dehydrogenase (short-subunit alcohol dehydrogenase family)